MSNNWFDVSINSNILTQIYFNGFVDVSCNIISRGNLCVENNIDLGNTRFGVGTLEPEYACQIMSIDPIIKFTNANSQNTNIGIINFKSSIRAVTSSSINFKQNGYLSFFTGGGNTNATEKMFITAGNVGIGTSSMPSSKTGLYVNGNVFNRGTDHIIAGTRAFVSLSDGSLVINYNKDNNAATFNGNVVVNGNVGINTEPYSNYSLYVNGNGYCNNIRVDKSLTIYPNADDRFIYFGEAGTSNDHIRLNNIGTTSGQAKISFDFYDDSSDARFLIRDRKGTSGWNRFYVDSGSTNVYGNSRINGGVIVDGNASDSYYHVDEYFHYGHIHVNENRNDATVRCNGMMYSQRAYTTSDKRIKTSIQTMNKMTAVNQLRQLKPCYFKYIDRNEESLSFIAQDVKDIDPYLVNITTSHVPNIYKVATINNLNNSIIFNDSIKELLCYDNSSKLFTKVKIFDSRNEPIILEIKKLISDREISFVETLEKYGDINNQIFVYGQEVNDFLSVQMDMIMTIGTATLKQLDETIVSNETQLDAMLYNDNYNKRINTIENKLNNILEFMESNRL